MDVKELSYEKMKLRMTLVSLLSFISTESLINFSMTKKGKGYYLHLKFFISQLFSSLPQSNPWKVYLQYHHDFFGVRCS